MNKEMQLLYKRAMLDRYYIEETIGHLNVKLTDISCIDVGCGPGASTQILYDCFPKSKIVVGIDNDTYAIACAKKQNQNNIVFACADAEHLPFKEGTFDFCFSRMLLDIAQNTEMILNEMIRVIKANGYIVLYGNVRTTAKGTVLPENADIIIDAYRRYIRLTKRKGFDVEYIVDLLEKAGLSCSVKKIVKDVNEPGRKDLLEYYSVPEAELKEFAKENILVKMHLAIRDQVFDYEQSLINLLNDEKVYLSFEQAIIVAKKEM